MEQPTQESGNIEAANDSFVMIKKRWNATRSLIRPLPCLLVIAFIAVFGTLLGIVGAKHLWIQNNNDSTGTAALASGTSAPTVAAVAPSVASVAQASPTPAPIASPLVVGSASTLFHARLTSSGNRCPGYQGDDCATNPCYKNLSKGIGESWLLLAPDRQSFQWNYAATGMKYIVRCYSKTVKNTSATGTSFGEAGGWGYDNWRLLDITPGSDPQPYVSNQGTEKPDTIVTNFPSGNVPWSELMTRLFSTEVFIAVDTDSGSGSYSLNNCFDGEIGGFYTVTSYGATAIPSPLGSPVVPPPGANRLARARPPGADKLARARATLAVYP